MFYGIFIVYMVLCGLAIDLEEEISRLKKSYSPHPFKSCFPNLGCLNTDETWFHKNKRPVNLEPLDRHTIKTEFILLKPPNASLGSQEIIYDIMSAKKETVILAGFKSGENCMFLFHDFTSNGYTGWVKHTAQVVTPKIPNIISVDWQSGAEPPFEQAISNARVVALEAIAFIKLLIKEFSITPNQIHLVGHGLGAHIAGYIGAYFKNIDRITGLDPTGPYFEGMPEEVKLDASDAKFVEIIHTNAFESMDTSLQDYRIYIELLEYSQGSGEAMGHKDFFINGARHQPGCNKSSEHVDLKKVTRNQVKEGSILPGCSHKRAFKYFIESLQSSHCEFIGIGCNSYENFLDDECVSCNKNKCAVMGVDQEKFDGKGQKYFVETGSESPFCMIAYEFKVTISENSKKQKGRFEVIIVGERNEVANASLSQQNDKMRQFKPGNTYDAVYYTSHPRIDVIKEAKVKWIHKKHLLCVIFCDLSIIIKEISLSVMSVKKQNYINRLCPATPNERITSGNYVEFVQCDQNKSAIDVGKSSKT